MQGWVCLANQREIEERLRIGLKCNMLALASRFAVQVAGPYPVTGNFDMTVIIIIVIIFIMFLSLGINLGIPLHDLYRNKK